jgi:hypothetical protein
MADVLPGSTFRIHLRASLRLYNSVRFRVKVSRSLASHCESDRSFSRVRRPIRIVKRDGTINSRSLRAPIPEARLKWIRV